MAQILILDTNVLSELMSNRPAEPVRRWFERQPRAHIHTTAITLAEISFGIALLPPGKRRSGLEALAQQIFAMLPPCLPFDREAALAYASLAARRQRDGLHIDTSDLQIAAIALVHHAAVATRNTTDFDDCGLQIINPWETPSEE